MSRLAEPVTKRDHSQGPSDAPVTLVEYGDYECPFCGRAYYIVKQIQGLLDGRLQFVFRNFPLTQIHPHALAAAKAAEAAGLQGKFWEMHDILFENQQALEPEDLLRYADQLGLDTQKFERDMDTDKVIGRIEEDFMSGIRSGVNGTPTFFINGRRHEGSFEPGVLLAAIERDLRFARV